MLQSSNWEEKTHQLYIWKRWWHTGCIRFHGDSLKKLFSLILSVLTDVKKAICQSFISLNFKPGSLGLAIFYDTEQIIFCLDLILNMLWFKLGRWYMNFAYKLIFLKISLHKWNIKVYKSVEATQFMCKYHRDETTLGREKLPLIYCGWGCQ